MLKLVSLLLIAGSVLAAATEDSHTVLYHRSGPPANTAWKLWKQAEDDIVVPFSIALKQRNLDKLERLFWENANPKSEDYAKHLSRDEILGLISPPEEVQNLITDWLVKSADEVAATIVIKNLKDVIQVRAPVHFINHLFQTKMHAFVNTETERVVLNHLGSLRVPKEIAAHLDLITGITEFPPSSFGPKEEESTEIEPLNQAYVDNSCNVPYSIRKLYNIPEDLIVTNPEANISIYSEWYLPWAKYDGFDVPDYSGFLMANNIPKKNITCIRGNAAEHYSPGGHTVESVLDVQMAQGMAPGATMCYFVMDWRFGWMFEFVTEIFNTPDAATVVSVSYGWNEDQQCINGTIDSMGNCTALDIPNSQTYVARTNVEFMKLGLAGFTVLVASGDNGVVSGSYSQDCKAMQPMYPASSPYVTVVGATSVENSTILFSASFEDDDLPPVCAPTNDFNCECSTSHNEQPAMYGNAARFDTGGGFSNINAMPTYQRDAVMNYLGSGVNLPATYFNTSGRAYPDVAGVGENFCVIQHVFGDKYACLPSGGTSASTPLWAGLVALLNQDRLNAGKTTLGFINPLLYQMFTESNTKFFNNNFSYASNSGQQCPKSLGFNAMAGHWTPLTGLGSPKFDMIRSYIQRL